MWISDALGVLPITCLVAGCFRRVTALLFRVVFFLFALGLGVGLFIPGMLCPSCCENTAGPAAKDRTNTTANKYLCRESELFIISSTWIVVRALG